MSLVLDFSLPYVEELVKDGFQLYNKTYENYDKRILLINLMPNKEETELQILKSLGKSNCRINIEYIYTKTYTPKHVKDEYLKKYYITFKEAIKKKFHGIIITGAPVETLDYENNYYWGELVDIFNYIRKNNENSLYICYGASAALYHYYGINKFISKEKIFGVFNHEILVKSSYLKGLDNNFKAPHSRYSYIKEEDIKKIKDIKIISKSSSGEVFALEDKFNNLFILGHMEYEEYTLKKEYLRDRERGISPSIPKDYFVDDDINKGVNYSWDRTKKTIFKNWLNTLN